MKKLVLIHGLNNNQKIWDDLTGYFEKDYEVIKITLLGHGEDYDQLRTFTGEDMVRDLVEKINTIPGPKNVVAYSLGALSLTQAIQNNWVRDIDKLVLMAPAFRVRFDSMVRFFSRWTILGEPKSFPPPAYKQHNRLPMNVYRVLLGLTDTLNFQNGPKESLIFCSRRDLLVDFKEIGKIKEQYGLNWELVDLNRPTTSWHPAFQHMIFNERYLGKLWLPMVEKIGEYFKS